MVYLGWPEWFRILRVGAIELLIGRSREIDRKNHGF